MNRILCYAARILAAALVAAILGRAVWVCSRTEGGWGILGEHFVAGLPPPLSRCCTAPFEHPNYQAAKWLLQQAEQLEADPKATVADLMSAALATMHDDSDRGQPWRWLPQPPVQDVGATAWGGWRDDLPDSWFDRAQALDKSLRDKSRQLAERATLLESDRPDWWRLRAVVVFSTAARGWRGSTDDLRVLDETRQHDPDNALYDYLIGVECFFESSVERDSGDGYDVRLIRDAEIFCRAAEQYRQGLAKKLLSTGGGGVEQRFYERVPGDVRTKLLCMQSWNLSAARDALYTAVAEPIWDAIGLHREAGDLSAMFRLWRYGHLRIAAQWAAGGEPLSMKITRAFSKNGFSEAVACFFHAESALPLKPEHAKVQSAVDQLVTLSDDEQNAYAPVSGRGYYWWDLGARQDWLAQWKVLSVAGVMASAAGFLILLVAISGILAARLVGGWDGKAPGRWPVFWPLLLWCAIFGVTFGVLGWVISYQPRWGDQYVVVQWSIVAVFVAAVGWPVRLAARLAWRKRGLPRGERGLAFQIARLWLVIVGTFVFVVPLFLAVDPKFRQGIVDLWESFPRVIVQHIEHRSIWAISRETPADAIVQWGYHGGLFWTGGVWLVVMIAIGLRQRAVKEQVESQVSTRRAWLATALRRTNRSALALAVALLLLSLAATAQWIDCLGAAYQRELDAMVAAATSAAPTGSAPQSPFNEPTPLIRTSD
jgi:hypothetical protein